MSLPQSTGTDLERMALFSRVLCRPVSPGASHRGTLDLAWAVSLPILATSSKHLRVDMWNTVLAFFPSTDDQIRSLESIYSTAPLLYSPYADPTPFLRAIPGRGRTLRRLRTPCPDVITLRAMAEVFPAVTHLHISSPGLSSARSTGESGLLDSGQPRVEDALALFPELEVVGGMEFENSADIRRLLASYPRLCGCEDPQFPS
ncbi:hypothetical protein BV25DRAFT_303462 [Artomyces pyxidatus]|uniref:Uncharacterized protein n=1 Tax=Artomyces pyxidatus TaxID=48021 RepID=A0ACB8T6F9_9AGAM|nr:hypothetical protein BV25DRAFT_303462 [Artomyces pyxidatus]